MLIKITDKKGDQIVFNSQQLNEYWRDLDHVVIAINKKRKIIEAKTQLQAKRIVAGITEAIEQHSGENIVDVNTIIENHHEEWLKDTMKSYLNEEKLNIKNADTARMTGEVDVEYSDFDDESMWFLLRDSVHDFRIGLIDVLSAVNFAEECGYLPALPKDWWNQVASHYPDAFRTDLESGRIICDNSKSEKEKIAKR